MNNIVEWFSIFPPQVGAMLISMLPIFELRGGIPIAQTVFKLDIFSAYVFSLIGNIIPAFFITWLLGPVSGYLVQRFTIAEKFFSWLFARTRNKFSGKYEKWGQLALIIFVAIPLPVTGVWTGSVAAFLFGIPKKTALWLLSIGAAIAGIIVSAMTNGIIFFV